MNDTNNSPQTPNINITATPTPSCGYTDLVKDQIAKIFRNTPRQTQIMDLTTPVGNQISISNDGTLTTEGLTSDTTGPQAHPTLTTSAASQTPAPAQPTTMATQTRITMTSTSTQTDNTITTDAATQGDPQPEENENQDTDNISVNLNLSGTISKDVNQCRTQ